MWLVDQVHVNHADMTARMAPSSVEVKWGNSFLTTCNYFITLHFPFQVLPMVEGEPYVSFLVNTEDENIKLRKKREEKALLLIQQVVKKTTSARNDDWREI